MTNCQFIDTPGGRMTCLTCGRPVRRIPGLRRNCAGTVNPFAHRTQIDTAPPREYTPTELPCEFRGPQLDEPGTCDQCGMRGKPFIQFECTLHGKCSLAQRHSAVKACSRCGDSPQIVEWPEHLRPVKVEVPT